MGMTKEYLLAIWSRRLPKGWKIVLDRRLRHSTGFADFEARRIRLAGSLTIADLPGFLAHEVAHVLAGPVGHGPKWQRIAKRLGCDATDIAIASLREHGVVK